MERRSTGRRSEISTGSLYEQSSVPTIAGAIGCFFERLDLLYLVSSRGRGGKFHMNASRLSGWYVSAAVTDLEACGRYSGDVFFNR